MTEEEPGDVLVFERPAPLSAWLVFAGALGALLAALLFGPGPLRDVIKPAAEGLPLGSGVVVDGTVLALFVAPLFLVPLAIRYLNSRYGRCELSAQRALLRPPVPWRHIVVPLCHVTGRTLTPHGVVLEADGNLGHLAFPWAQPLLVPTRNDAEVGQVVAMLDGVERAQQEGDEARVFGRTWRIGPLLKMALQLVLYASLPAVIVGGRFGVDAGLGALLGVFVAISLAWGPLFGQWYAQRRLIHVGQTELALDHILFPYGAIQELAVGEGALSVRGPRGAKTVWVEEGTDDLRALLRERYRAAGRDPEQVSADLPAWARSRLNRRRGLLWAVPPALVVLVSVVLAWSAPNHGALFFAGPGGLQGQLVLSLDDGTPRFLITSRRTKLAEPRVVVPGLWSQAVGGNEEALLRVDLTRGVAHVGSAAPFAFPPGTTWIHVPFEGLPQAHQVELAGTEAAEQAASRERGQDGRVRQLVRSIVAAMQAINAQSNKGKVVFSQGALGVPAELDDLIRTEDPLLGDWLAGRTSLRCVRAVDGAGSVAVWGVDQGAPLFLVVAPPGRTFSLHGPDVVYKEGGGVPSIDVDGPRALRLDINGGVVAEAPLPTFAELWTATEAVRQGSSVEAFWKP